MLKRWYEKRPFTFGAVFIFFYMTIPIIDKIFIIPKMQCEINCKDWIINNE